MKTKILKFAIAGVVFVSCVLPFQTQAQTCYHIECIPPLIQSCGCGVTDCLLSWSETRPSYLTCVSGGSTSGRWNVCQTTTKIIGTTAPCIKSFNLTVIAACGGAAYGTIRPCVERDWAACVGALLQLPNACSFCQMVICMTGVTTKEYGDVYYFSEIKNPEACSSPQYPCDSIR